eukprot:GILJ01003177.1.p1 GENE.GILJ01003177.1~~GILJ01003177.1.p1  ORF type:complete len:131 (-),score=17.98 GILJ01003177.1:150-500(-)
MKTALFAFCLVAVVAFVHAQTFGGYTESRPADAEVMSLCRAVRLDVEARHNGPFQTFEPISYQSQVVAGTNYNIKVKISGTEFVHIKVFKPLPHTNEAPQLVNVVGGKTADDALAF